ncbi:MAG: DHH family phosphoesterase [Candidatus Aenigmatarchaeota archaeon]
METSKDTEKIQTLLKWLEYRNGGTKLLFYHQDADGVCSAALLMKFFPQFKYYAREGPRIEDKFIDWAVTRSPDLMVFVDIPVDQEWKNIQEIRKRVPEMRFVIIDHHIPEKDMTQKNVVHFNPRFDEPGAYIPASWMIYDLLKKMDKDVRPWMWMASIGIIGDYAIKDCSAFLKECGRAFPGLLDGDDVFTTKLGVAAELISSSITLKGLQGASYSLRRLVKAKGFPDFSNDSELKAWHKIVREEIDKLIGAYPKNHSEHEKLIDYEIDSALNIVSVISTILSKENPQKIVMVRKRSGAGWKVSMRNQNLPENLGEIVKKAIKDIGIGGGHERAAGAMIFEKESVETFKQRLVEQLG